MKSRARAIAKAQPNHGRHIFLTFFGLILTLALTSVALAQETIIKSHGYSRFGDLKYPADFTHFDYVNPNAPKGGEFSSFAIGSFDNIHRYTHKGDHAGSATIFFESLMAGSADEVDSFYGLLAETIEYPENRQWAIFTLRPEAKFSDGTDVKASDVVFSHEILKEKGLPSLRALFADFVSVEALDEDRVKFTFTEGLPLSVLSEQISLAAGSTVFSEAWWSGNDKDGNPRDFGETTLEAPLGSGPYVLHEMDPGRMISYKYNPDYWGKDLAINKGQNNFDVIRYEYYGDTVAAMEGFKAGNFTFRSENSSKVWATGYDFPAIDEGWVIKDELPNGNLANAQNYVFNLRNEKFNDPKVREAIGLMFNFEWSNKTLFYDLYARVQSYWGNSELEAKGPPSAEEAAILQEVAEHLPDDILTAEAIVPVVSGTEQLDRDSLRRASALLDEAGWPIASPPPLPSRLPSVLAWIIGLGLLGIGLYFFSPSRTSNRWLFGTALGTLGAAAILFLGMPIPAEPDGKRRNADGEVLSVDILYFSPAFTRIHEPFAENLKRIGIDATLTKVDSAQYSNRLETFDFEMITQSIGTDLSPGLGLRQWFNSSGVTTNTGNRNLAGFSNPAVDQLVERIIASKDRDELILNTRALDRAMRSLKWTIPQWFKDVHTVAYWDLYSHPETIPPFALGVVSLWWYDEEKAAKLKAEGAL